MNIKGVIFDLDGLIFDSEIHSLNSFEAACRQTGLPFEKETFYSLIGVVHADEVRILTELYGKQGYDTLMEAYHRIYKDGYGKKQVLLKPGALELISGLKKAGFPMCLATSSTMVHVHDSFDNSPFGSIPFTVMVTSDDGTASKPDPEVFLRAAAKLDLPPENCLILEDSHNGIRAAIAAGSISCMVPDLLPPDDFIREHATFIKKDLFEVIELLRPFVSL